MENSLSNAASYVTLKDVTVLINFTPHHHQPGRPVFDCLERNMLREPSTMVTQIDIARHAGVSKETVYRAFKEPEAVDAKTRRIVWAAAAELGYRANATARGPASQSSKSIGVVVNNFSSMYYGALLDGAERAITANGFKMLAESTHERAKGEVDAWTSLLERQCDAVIIHSDLLEDDQLSQLMEVHPQSVLMNRLLPGFEDRCIYFDNYRGSALAAQYLYDKGHRRIAMITGPAGRSETRSRSNGFLDTLRHYDLDPLIVEGTFLERGGYDAMVKIFDHGESLTAIFAQNDQMAAGALLACRENGYDVPRDLSIIGYDDIPTARHLAPKLTTIRQPLQDIGAAAGHLAYALITGAADTSDVQRFFEPEIIERDSVKGLE